MRNENGKNWNHYIKRLTNRPNTSGFLVFLSLSIFIITLGFLRNQILINEENQEMDTILSGTHHQIEQSLNYCYTTTVSLALTLNKEGIPENFETISKELLKSNPIVSTVQLVPNGVIKYIYPLKGNEVALNLNVLGTGDLKTEAKKSIESQKIYFAGPLKLRQGGIGIVGRLPIYKNNSFWGFSAVIIKLETLLEYSGFNKIDKSKYYYQFSKKNPITLKEHFLFPLKKDFSKSKYLSKPINDCGCTLYLVALNPYSIDSSVLFSVILGIIIALLLGFLTTRLLKRPKELGILLKEQETRLLNNEMKFKTIFDQVTIGLIILDAKTGNILDANNKYCNMLGFTLDEIKEKGVASMTHPKDLELTVSNIKKLHEGKITEYIAEKRTLTKTGKYIWVNLTINPLWESNEKPNTLIAFIKDITDVKENEELIKKNQARYKSLIDSIDGIVWEYDLETSTSTFVSKKIEGILGYSADEYSDNTTFWEDHIHPEDSEFAIALSAKENKNFENYDYEYRMIKKNGDVIWIRDSINYVFENDKPVSSRGIMIDITKMKDAEKSLNNSFNLVSDQNKRLLNFSYIVSHNLRSHTSNIESILSLIEAAESDEERDEMLLLLKSVSNSLDETMSHLNEVVNINTNINLAIKPLDFRKYIIKAQEILNEQIKLNQVTFKVAIPDDAIIDFNSAYLESTIYNLISNAIRYRHPQRKPIITIKLYKENKENVIEVTDNGIGIDLAKNGDKIFGMYKTFSNNPDARGIGLFITKNQIEAMGGRITVESELNIGTTFKIYTK
ncbi:MAG: PAS domain S-box protein [Flavobacterium sp.]|uniref:PAS domain S-box protein n=1 Tax=Flavobacterium sp. TaxID=239 RepID=UPI0026195893|nr:PAS domain S-box protein [Flavobacterium sp.]MDD5152286.1 PAS domain S-box protein [Flavobacterium sp.]